MGTRLVVGFLVAWGCIILLSGAPALAGCYPDNNNPPCEGNLDYDCDVDGTDAAKFKQDFGRGIKNPCPSNGPAPVGRTGQTTPYYEGDDGGRQKGVGWPNPRFTDNGDGTVRDNLTGLIWLKNANCFGLRSWVQALTDCNVLANGQCGLTDGSSGAQWRLPNRLELESLINMKYWEPALPNTAGTGQWTLGDPFTNLITDGYYWSSTTMAYDTDSAWTIGMFHGSDGYSFKDGINYVWPVRGGQ